MLYIVATPIGNLSEITLRALEVLRSADLILCEDCRHSLKLLNHYGIKKPLQAHHKFNEKAKIERIIGELGEGKNIALISDAGMPGISDPGADLVRLAIEAGIETVIIPGPNAALSALVLSGLESSRFTFEGFLPREGGKRRLALTALAAEQRTLIFYEAPHRLLATLRDMAAAFGEQRPAAAGRELTKLHEEMVRGSLGDLLAHFNETAPRGEFTLVVAGALPPVPKIPPEGELTAELAALITAGQGRKEAAKTLAQKYGLSVKQMYRLGLKSD